VTVVVMSVESRCLL